MRKLLWEIFTYLYCPGIAWIDLQSGELSVAVLQIRLQDYILNIALLNQKGIRMIVAETKKEIRKQVKEWKKQGLTVGLVPTMGALHEGHASLVDASGRECDRVVASVFVNPTQFAANEDLESYPRDFERDCRILEEHGCDMVFHPSVEEMYPAGFAAAVDIESEMTNQLCGKSRATHFKGVCTVVSKLFNIVGADKAYFGEKDAQQLAVIKTMVRDLDMDIEIVGCPTIREEDGLAKSSRNVYLSAEERKAAQVIYRALVAAQNMIKGAAGVATAAGMAADAVKAKVCGADDNVAKVKACDSDNGAADIDCSKADACNAAVITATAPTAGVPANAVLKLIRQIISSEPMAKIEYIEAVDGMSLMPVDTIKSGDLIAVAVHFGKTRLIDNFTVK